MKRDKPIDVLIADDDSDICYLMGKFLNSVDDIHVCGTSNSGKDTLEKIYSINPDIVLLDIMMPSIDGIGVLTRLKETPPKKVPKIIMTTAMAKDAVTKKAMDLGACYYILKPCDFNSLLNSIYMVADAKMDDLISKNNENKRERLIITKTLMDMGVPSHIDGYHYISYALMILLASGTFQNLYLHIGEHFSNTPQCVESSIRKAISKTEMKKTDAYVKLFGEPGSEGYKKPTNSSFMSNLLQYIELNYI